MLFRSVLGRERCAVMDLLVSGMKGSLGKGIVFGHRVVGIAEASIPQLLAVHESSKVRSPGACTKEVERVSECGSG